MSATTDIYVSPSTSLVLLKSLSSVTNIYLPSFASSVPLFSVTIRDTTGLSSILSNPVRISTIGSASFVDGTSYYPLDRPYGLVNVSLRNSNTWQVNHTSGKPPALAAATIGILSTNSSFFTTLSTSQKFVSTYRVENLTTPNSISITSPFIVNNLSTPGFVLIEGTFLVRDNVRLNGQLYVSGPTLVVSSVFTEDLGILNGLNNTVLSSIGIGGSLYVSSLSVKSTLTLQSTVQVSTLQVTLSSLQETSVFANQLRVAGLFSTLGQLAVGGKTVVGNQTVLTQEVSTLGGLFSTLQLSVDKDVTVLGNLSSVGALQNSFFSSVQAFSTLDIKQSLTLESTLGLQGTLYTSSFSTLTFSTLGSFSTNRLALLSSASVSGNVSTFQLQSYQYLSIGKTLYLPGSLSSMNITTIRDDVTVLGNTTVATGYTSSSVGVAQGISVYESTLASFAAIHQNIQASDLTTEGFTTVQSAVGVGDKAFVYGNMRVLGEPTISSFLVKSFLLSNVQIVTSSPFTSFQASSLHASTFITDFTRISAPLPDIYAVSTTYASTTQLNYAITENARLDYVYTDSFFLGDTRALAQDSQPLAAINVKSQFGEGISSLNVRADTVTSTDEIRGSLVGTVSYLSNVRMPFANFSAINTYLSSLTVSSLYASSFTASTFVINKLGKVFSTVITPYLVFESQGFEPRYDTNQFLTLNPKKMVVNRHLTFDRTNNYIGLFQSTPQCDLDISGQVYATNFYFSSINMLSLSTTGTVVYSTITTSSSYVRDNLTYGENGFRLASQNGYFEIIPAVSSFTNAFGLYDCEPQSSILLNSGLTVGRYQKVVINPVLNIQPSPVHALTVTDTVRTEELHISTLNLIQSLQTTSITNPTFTINSNTVNPLNSLSASINKLCMNNLMTIQNNLYESQRYVGINTLQPSASLDVQGNAYFSTLYSFGPLRTNYVAMDSQDL